jgi:DNA-binding transcriptional MerR regulator
LTPGKLAATFVCVDDYDIDDLVRLSGYSARGIRHYITNRLLPRPKLAGNATRYTRGTLGCLAAIRALRDKDGLSIARIKRLLRGLTPEELEDWACELDPPEGTIGEAPLTVQSVGTRPRLRFRGALDARAHRSGTRSSPSGGRERRRKGAGGRDSGEIRSAAGQLG